MPSGTIRRLAADRGFGFIKCGEDADIFFHSSELQGADFAALREGQVVEFGTGRGQDGRTEAVKVRLVAPQVMRQTNLNRPSRADSRPRRS